MSSDSNDSTRQEMYVATPDPSTRLYQDVESELMFGGSADRFDIDTTTPSVSEAMIAGEGWKPPAAYKLATSESGKSLCAIVTRLNRGNPEPTVPTAETEDRELRDTLEKVADWLQAVGRSPIRENLLPNIQERNRTAFLELLKHELSELKPPLKVEYVPGTRAASLVPVDDNLRPQRPLTMPPGRR